MDEGAARTDRLRHEIRAGRPRVVDEIETNILRDVLEPKRTVGLYRRNRSRDAGPAAERSETQAQQDLKSSRVQS